MYSGRLGPPLRLLVAAGVVALLLASGVSARPRAEAGAPFHDPAASPVAPTERSRSPGTSAATGSLPYPAWQNLSGALRTAPSSRDAEGLVYDAADGYDVMFGGFVNPSFGAGVPLGDTWIFNGSWRNITASLAVAPSPRSYMDMEMAYDAADGYVLIFGGYTYNGAVGDTWEFSGGSWTNVTGSLSVSPSPRYEATLAYDAADREVVMFGGLDASGNFLAQTWVWKGGAWTLLHPSTSPPARRMAQMDYDPSSGDLLLFSGIYNYAARTDTWAFHAGVWTQLNPSPVPPGRWGGTLREDPRDGYDVLFGGCTSIGCLTSLNETWAWKNGSWTNLTGDVRSPPADRGDFPLTFDGALGSIVGFGGGLPGPFATYMTNDTWTYSWPTLSAKVVALPARLDVGTSLSLSVNLSGGAGSLTGTFLGSLPGCLPTAGLSEVCAPNATGTFEVAFHVADPVLQENTSPWENISVFPDPGLNVSWAPATPEVGAALTIWANTSGGSGGFTFHYAGLPPGCVDSGQASISCTPLSAGSFPLDVTATDSSGLTASRGPLPLDVQPAAAVTVGASSTYGAVPFPVTFLATSLGGFAPFTYLWTFGDGGNGTGARLSHTFEVPGLDVVSVVERDAEGAVASANVTIRVVDPVALRLTTVPATSEIDLGQNLTVGVVASGGDGNYSFTWSGLPPGCPAAPTPILRCLPVAAGIYSVEVKVADGHGLLATAGAKVSVFRSLSASVVVGPERDCGGPSPVVLAANVSGGSSPFNVTWTFGDGSAPGNGSPVNHTYPGPGQYVVQVAVADAAGSVAQAQMQVNLTGLGCPSGAPSGWFGLGPAGELLLLGGLLVAVAGAVGVVWWRRRSSSTPDEERPGPG